MPFTFADIPENVHTKKYLPLLHNIWKGYQEFGWEYFQKVFKIFTSEFYTLATNRLNESILAAKLVLEGKFKDPSQVLAYAFFPPVITIREDLQTGTEKLLFGESVDTSFLVVDDDTRDILFILNCHIEDGIPVDWWTVGGGDEVLDRRHLKLGYKLRQFPQKIKKFTDIGLKAIDVLQDIRNERSPQWSTSNYMTSTVWCSSIINQIEYTSNYASFGGLWDGMQAASNFDLPDALFCFCPWPPMIKTFTLMGRSNFILRLTGLSTEHRLYTQGETAKNVEWLMTNVPELMDLVTHQVWEKIGIPRPSETITEEYPHLNEKNDLAKKYTLTSREQTKIKCEDLGLTWREAVVGVYLDVTHDTPETDPIDASRIISTGIGSETQFRKKTSG
ncbi:MAG: hypothetical protein LUQ65_02175 [Candidatus Helarchaeota archaeon]|nr:hypothetical protein [Candidatus Helarchaeota archaeon]